ncbi:MAG TPA: response regulator [Candidatus Acidoferrum sp.]|nr:response regulator [Candidatus Acidoferrum sp.]
MQPLTILVVEDSEVFSRFIYSLLQSWAKLQVEMVSDGLEAIQKATEIQPDLILLDIGLPTLNGMEVAKRIREFAPAAKILFISVEADVDLVREALALGAGYVHKPRAQRDLLSAIEAVLRGEQFVSEGLGWSRTTGAPQRHEVQFYSDDSVLLESFARSIVTALETGNAAIVIATKSHRENLIQRLKAEGIDVDGAVQQGTYTSLDAIEMLLTIMASGVPDVVRFFEGLCRFIALAAQATKKEHPRIAICSECVGLLCSLGNTQAAIRLEKAGKYLVQAYNVDILCAYPLSSFDGGEDNHAFKRVCAEHTFVYSR